jgi:two-component system NarL family sensor kinase
MENERRRLGRELHTGVGQLLAAIRLQSELIATRLVNPEDAVTQALDRIERLVQDALDQVRSISSRIYPPRWQQVSLEGALRHLWTLSGIPERFEANLQLAPLGREPDLEFKILIYRAAQEGLANIARHSRAVRVSLILETVENQLILRIRDNGVGFDPALAFSRDNHTKAGIGLHTIRDQAEGLGGKMSIESGPHGTTLEVSVPRPE